MTIACIRGGCRKRMVHIKALCVDRDSSDFGKSIKIEIPDGYVILPSEDDDMDKLRRKVQHLRAELEELVELGQAMEYVQMIHPNEFDWHLSQLPDGRTYNFTLLKLGDKWVLTLHDAKGAKAEVCK